MMNYLDTAKVAAEKFPYRKLMTEKPAEVEIAWIQALATLALADEMRKLRQNSDKTTGRAVRIYKGQTYSSYDTYWPDQNMEQQIMRFAEYHVEKTALRRETSIWGLIRAWMRGSGTKADPNLEENENGDEV